MTNPEKTVVISRRAMFPKLAATAGAVAVTAVILKPQEARADVDAQIDNIAALKARTVPSGSNTENVLVRGYYVAGDGGGGLFCWNPSPTTGENNGTVIKSNNTNQGRWVRLESNPLNVKWFGAKGDGTTDDRECIQGCITAAEGWAKNNGGQATIVFPPGSYKLATFQSGSIAAGGNLLECGNMAGGQVSLNFIGQSGAQLYHAASATSGFSGERGWIALMLYPNLRDVVIDSLEFYSDHGASNAGGFTGYAGAIMAFHHDSFSTSVLSGLTIRNCRFRNTAYAFDSFYTNNRTGLKRLSIVNNHFIYENGADSGVVGGAFGNTAIRVVAANDVIVSNNIFDGAANSVGSQKNLEMDGFYFGCANSNEVVSNNLVRHFSFEGILIGNDRQPGYYARGHVVSGNVLDCTRAPGATGTSGQTGIWTGFATTNIVGNVIKGGVGSSRVDLQACKLEYSIVSPK